MNTPSSESNRYSRDIFAVLTGVALGTATMASLDDATTLKGDSIELKADTMADPVRSRVQEVLGVPEGTELCHKYECGRTVCEPMDGKVPDFLHTFESEKMHEVVDTWTQGPSVKP